MKKVLLPWPIDKELAEIVSEAKKPLEELRRFVDVDTSPISDEGEFFGRSKGAYVVLNPRVGFCRYREFLGQAEELRMIQSTSIGYDGVDIEACTEKGVIFCNVAEVMAESVAQHNWALILDVSKNVSKSDRTMRVDGWLRQGRFGIELYGKTLGIVGLGAIGGRVALKGSLAFGMRILAYDPYVLPARAQLYGAQLVDLGTLLKESDIVSVNCPLTPETLHLLGEEQLRLLKPTAILVNTARGAIIDEKALIEALESRKLFGAGLDVFEDEPLSQDSLLRKFENVVLTSHIASSTKEAFSKTWKGAVENILRFIKGERPHWVVNPEALIMQRQKA